MDIVERVNGPPAPRTGLSGAANVAGFAATTAIALLLTPFLIRRLGAEGYGAWALVAAAVMVLQLADLGLPRALSRSVAAAWRQGDAPRIAEALGAALALMLLAGCGLAVTLLLASATVVRWLAVPAAWQADVQGALALAALALVPSLAALALASVLEGLQRMELSNLALVAGRGAFALVALATIGLGLGVRGLAVASLVGVLVQLTAAAWGLRRAWPGAHLARPRRTLARGLLRFGLPVLASHAIGLAYTPLSKLALARTTSVGIVGHYEAISSLSGQLFLLAWALSMASFPALAAAWLTGQAAAAAHLYRRAMRWGAIVVLPLGVLLLALARPLLAAWMGADVPGLGAMLRVVAAGWLVDALAAPAGMALQAAGKPGHALLAVGVNGGINAVLSLGLAPRYGLAGVAAANLVSALVSSALMLALCRRALGPAPRGLDAWRHGAMWLAPLAWLAVAALVLRQMPVPSLALVGAVAAGYLAVYGLALWVWGPLAADERAWLHAQMQRLRRGTAA